jgi:RNA polymerase-binding protein DksA
MVVVKAVLARKVAAAPELPPKPIKKVFKVAQLREYRKVLQSLHDRVVDEISFLAGDNLNRSQRESSGDLSSYSFHMADQGTDNFDREFALNLVSSEQDILYEIDEALHRVDAGTYGVCENCTRRIEKQRLRALPFAKMCVACKSAAEKGKTRFRPFGPTLSHSAAEGE